MCGDLVGWAVDGFGVDSTKTQWIPSFGYEYFAIFYTSAWCWCWTSGGKSDDQSTSLYIRQD